MADRRTLLILAASLALVGGCSAFQHPEIRAVRPHVTGIDLKGVSLTIDVDISNPYPIAVRAPRFQYAIDIEDSEFMKSQAPVEINLPAGQVGTASLPARFEYLQLWQSYKALADASEVKYRLHGTIPISALGQTHELPLSHEGKFPVLRLPQFDVNNVDFSDVSLSKAKATVTATIHNPNVFALGAKALGYTLVWRDAPVGSLTAATAQSIAAGQSGELKLQGEITARSVLMQALKGGGLGDAKLKPTGTIETPYGPVKLEP